MMGIWVGAFQRRLLGEVLIRCAYVGIGDQWGIEAHGPRYRRQRITDDYRTGAARQCVLEWAAGSFHAERFVEWAFFETETGGEPEVAKALPGTVRLSPEDALTLTLTHDDAFWLPEGVNLRS